MTIRRAIIVGATSGIGCELAKVFAAHGCEVGVAGRRSDLLEKLAGELATRTCAAVIDVRDTEPAIRSLEKLLAEMGEVDIIVISAGTGHVNPSLDWPPEKDTIDTNVAGFAAMAGTAMGYFARRGSGHLVGISSVAGARGDGMAPAYNASKAFISNYLEGLRKKAAKEGLAITVTDIRPGFVDTAMMKSYADGLSAELAAAGKPVGQNGEQPASADRAKGKREGFFWVASPDRAAAQIYEAIRHRKKRAYITRRWAVVGWVLRNMPDPIYNRI